MGAKSTYFLTMHSTSGACRLYALPLIVRFAYGLLLTQAKLWRMVGPNLD
jgi:hypothetical protein